MLMITIVDEQLPGGARIEGFCEQAYRPVLEAFRENFANNDELGASVCITHRGTSVVDLWGGTADEVTGRPWERDTLVIVFSSTKGAVALIANMLAERGNVRLHDDVATLWPEFGRHGKGGTTLAMMLSHTAPVPVLRDPVPKGLVCDWDYMVDRIADEPAWWEPGTRQGYHAMTFAWTVGQVFRLATGRSIGKAFREEVAEPLGIDFWIGLPDEQMSRLAAIIRPPAPDPSSAMARVIADNSGSITALMLSNSAGTDYNAPEVCRAEIGSTNGITNGRGLAGMYTPLANGGGGLVSEDTISAMSRVTAATLRDATVLNPMRFGLGFMASIPDRPTGPGFVIGERAFGHVGSGGSCGFGDPEAGLGFGYAMNRGIGGGMLDARGASLVDAAYNSLGWKKSPGAWRP
jgi:CubicO group peptidase (beta-lactamase class C family)